MQFLKQSLILPVLCHKSAITIAPPQQPHKREAIILGYPVLKTTSYESINAFSSPFESKKNLPPKWCAQRGSLLNWFQSTFCGFAMSDLLYMECPLSAITNLFGLKTNWCYTA